MTECCLVRVLFICRCSQKWAAWDAGSFSHRGGHLGMSGHHKRSSTIKMFRTADLQNIKWVTGSSNWRKTEYRVFWVVFFETSQWLKSSLVSRAFRAELLHHVEEQLTAHYRQDRTESASCSLCRPAGWVYPGTSLVRAGCSVVTGGSFEGGQTATGTSFLPAEGSAQKGQSSDLRLQIGWLPRRGKSGWGRVTHRHALTLVWSSEGNSR